MKIDKIAILRESETGGGVSSFLKYLLKSKSYLIRLGRDN
jgi:hypothetical protein